jgi:DNA-binding transcriptional MerR regulator
MDIKTLLGEAYKDGMTIEEINAALADKEFVDPTTLPKSVSKEVFDKTASELAKVKKELKALRESSMTDAEKLQAELDKAKETQANYNKELSKLRAKEIFVTAGLTETDYAPILDVVVSEDEETTKTRAKSMVDLIAAQKAATEKAIKAELLKGTPKPKPGEGGSSDGDFDKKIEEARENGDMATVAALIRQQAMSEKK